MAKYYTTTEELTSIADAIRAKTGSNEQLEFPDEFVDAIDGIRTGGGSISGDKVIFIDYDGTVVQEYSAEEALALTELPSNPSHSRLIAQGWNWTLAQIKEQLRDFGGDVVVGQLYTTVSGAIEIDITLDDPDLLSPYLICAPNGEFEIDWGDNSTNDIISGTTYSTSKSIQHIYSTIGNYTIKLFPNTEESKIRFFNNGNSYSTVLSIKESLGYNSQYANTITNIYLTNNYCLLGSDFNELRSLKTLTYSNNITIRSIGHSMDGCNNLLCVILPQTLTKLADYACAKCYVLKYCSLPYTITELSGSSLSDCSLLQTITIPKNLTSLSGGNIFSNCQALEKIILPEVILTIPSGTFQYCFNLKKIKFSQNLVSIGNNAFYACYNLENITIPDSITSIGTQAFCSCHSIVFTKIPSTMTELNSSLFYEQYLLETISIPSNITTLGTYLFYKCYNLKQMVIPSTVTTISSSNMFANCYSLKTLEINNNMTATGTFLCYNCHSLYKIKLPDTLTTIETNAFYNCFSLSTITIPENVTSIGNNVFSYCSNMQEYHFKPTTPPTLKNVNAFTGIPSDCIIYVPYSSDHSILAAYQGASNWSTYANKMQEEPAPISE